MNLAEYNMRSSLAEYNRLIERLLNAYETDEETTFLHNLLDDQEVVLRNARVGLRKPKALLDHNLKGR